MTSYIKLFTDYDETFDEMSDDEAGRLIKAVIHYGATGEILPLSGGERLVFGIIKRQIDRDNESADAHRIAGQYGGRPRTKENQTEPNETKRNQTEPKTAMTKEKEEDKEKDKDKDNDARRARAREKLALFERFWAAYPRKTAKQDAARAFGKINVDEPLLAVMLAAVEKQKASEQWADPRYIPHPATWLNGRRGEDEGVRGTGARATAQTQYAQREYEDERKVGEKPRFIIEMQAEGL